MNAFSVSVADDRELPYNTSIVNSIVHIGLVGDLDATIPAHQAIPRAFDLVSTDLAITIQHHWMPTNEIDDCSRLGGMNALWCVPGSPYRSREGSLRAIRFAREKRVPFLGTCGGFQHAALEYARNVLAWTDAEHAETAPNSARLVVTPLSCALVEKTGCLHLRAGSKLASAYQSSETTEGYHCRYGLNPKFRSLFETGPLHVSAEDDAGDVRAVELAGHPFFVGTLFQPERAALAGKMPPLVKAFVEAAMVNANFTSRCRSL